MELNHTSEQMDLKDIHRTFHPAAAEYTRFSSTQGTFSRIDLIGHKTILGVVWGFFFFLSFFLFLFFIFSIEHEQGKDGGGGERENDSSRPHTECGAQCGAHSHKHEIMT